MIVSKYGNNSLLIMKIGIFRIRMIIILVIDLFRIHIIWNFIKE